MCVDFSIKAALELVYASDDATFFLRPDDGLDEFLAIRPCVIIINFALGLPRRGRAGMLPKLGCLLREPHREDTNPLRNYHKRSLETAPTPAAASAQLKAAPP